MTGDALLRVLATLANPHRLRVVAALAQQRNYVSRLARELGISRALLQVHLRKLEAAGLVTLAGKGYQGSTYAKIPYKGKNKPDSQKQANKAHAKLRAPGERANAQLKTWKILTNPATYVVRVP